MPNDYVLLDVPAGNGVGVETACTNRGLRTIMVTGTWAGLVVLEGTVDSVNWAPLPDAALSSAGFITTTLEYTAIRVRRKSIPVGATPGTPVVSMGRVALVNGLDALPPPVGLNGAGVAVSVAGYMLETVFVNGSFANPGMVVSVEVSMDGTCYVPLMPSCTIGKTIVAPAAAQWARQKIANRTAASPIPVVSVSGPLEDICFVQLALPAGVNGPGAASDTSGCGPYKTIICSAPGGEVPGLVAVEGSNDGGNTWVRLTGWNTTGLRRITALCQFMRLNLSGFREMADPSLCVGVGSIEGDCDTPTPGEATTDVSGEI